MSRRTPPRTGPLSNGNSPTSPNEPLNANGGGAFFTAEHNAWNDNRNRWPAGTTLRIYQANGEVAEAARRAIRALPPGAPPVFAAFPPPGEGPPTYTQRPGGREEQLAINAGLYTDDAPDAPNGAPPPPPTPPRTGPDSVRVLGAIQELLDSSAARGRVPPPPPRTIPDSAQVMRAMQELVDSSAAQGRVPLPARSPPRPAPRRIANPSTAATRAAAREREDAAERARLSSERREQASSPPTRVPENPRTPPRADESVYFGLPQTRISPGGTGCGTRPSTNSATLGDLAEELNQATLDEQFQAIFDQGETDQGEQPQGPRTPVRGTPAARRAAAAAIARNRRSRERRGLPLSPPRGLGHHQRTPPRIGRTIRRQPSAPRGAPSVRRPPGPPGGSLLDLINEHRPTNELTRRPLREQQARDDLRSSYTLGAIHRANEQRSLERRSRERRSRERQSRERRSRERRREQ